MKYLIFSLILLFSSCRLSKDSLSSDYDLNEVSNNLEVIDEYAYDEAYAQSNPDTSDLELHWRYVQELSYYEEEPVTVSSPVNSTILTEYNIINYTDTTKVLDNGFGTIAYNIPNKFRVDEYSTIKLRISKSKEIESVVIGDRNIPIVGTNSNDEVIVETIKIDNLMSANLYTDESLFEVSMVNKNAEQSLYKDGYTEWIWRVRPLKPGNHYIKMLITISGRDIVVYEKNIPVESNWKFSFSEWFSKWWQAITATIVTPIIIPFIIWFYRRRKNKKDT